MVSLQIGDLRVPFPYPQAYPEQVDYMTALKGILETQGHAVLEMPTGTGKTAALLSLILAFRAQNRRPSKLIYCTRTVAEVDKVVQELKKLQACADYPVLGLSLSSRKNLCANAEVKDLGSRLEVDSACWTRTAPWTTNRCPFYTNYEARSVSWRLEPGIYSLSDLHSLCESAGLCPYFTTRHFMSQADVIVLSYQYILDPRIAAAVTSDLPADSVVVFDEAHNIDNVCIEALSLNITRKTIHSCIRSVEKLRALVKEARETDAKRLQEEYQRLVQGLKQERSAETRHEFLSIPSEYVDEMLPGSIRKAEHFLSFLSRVVGYLKQSLKTKDARILSPAGFGYYLKTEGQVDFPELKFASDRLRSLLLTLKTNNLMEYFPLQIVCDLCGHLGKHLQGFTVIIEPYPELPSKYDPVLQFACLDASLGVRGVFQRFSSVILTSGTISPINFYQKMLNFSPVAVRSIDMTVDRPCICPLILTKGSDQLAVSSKFEERDDEAIIRNYGDLLVQLSETIPDGIVCFFPSYKYLEEVVLSWSEKGIMHQILESKLIYFESRNREETNMALHHYRLACDCGRGAVFMSIARGKVAEGIDFLDHYGRCIVLFGVPFQNTLSRVLRARLGFLKDKFGIDEREFLNFDAMRQAAQCAGRAIRSKSDYAVLLLADKRYLSNEKKEKLPNWIKRHFSAGYTNLSTDVAVQLASDFLRKASKRPNP